MAKTKVYEGKSVDVTWDGKLCIHIGECGRAKGELFVGGRDPWCDPDVSADEDVADVCERCPTGALTYEAKSEGGPTETATEVNRVIVSSDGPLYLRGDLQIDGAEAKGLAFRAALCRCGASKNKPFCDNSHRDAGFRDYGAIGEANDESAESGPLKVAKAKNGPLLLNGAFELVSGSGRVSWRGTKAALCRCGASKNKPFCDGAHKAAGFEAE